MGNVEPSCVATNRHKLNQALYGTDRSVKSPRQPHELRLSFLSELDSLCSQFLSGIVFPLLNRRLIDDAINPPAPYLSDNLLHSPDIIKRKVRRSALVLLYLVEPVRELAVDASGMIGLAVSNAGSQFNPG